MLVLSLIVGCGGFRESNFKGYIIEIDTVKNKILVAADINEEQAGQLISKEIPLDSFGGVYWLSQVNASKWTVGDQVEVWHKPAVDQSFPAQTGARKVVKVNGMTNDKPFPTVEHYEDVTGLI